MTSVGEVVQQLRSVVEELDKAATILKRAQVDAEQAQAHYAEAARGTDHPATRRAIQESRTAAEKSGKSARLASEAATAFAEYANHIAPGAMPARTSAPTAAPAGKDLVSGSHGRGPVSARLLGGATTVRGADDGFQHIKKLGNAVQRAAGPGGVVQKPSGPAFQAADQQKPGAGDALLAAFTLVIMGIKATEVAARFRRRLEDRQGQKGNENG